VLRLLRFLCLLALPLAGSALAAGPVKVVYHFSSGIEQASAGLEYIRNHLEVDPKATIVVVAHAAGVDFLMKGAKSVRGNEFRQAVEDLELQGVQFRVCQITLRERNLKKEQFLPQVTFVPSGVAEIARLQSQDGFAYLKP
jgi:intracellular sulfur oxidation DsrE/DsrF family protein